jgi:hypothetical protein
VLAAPPFIAWKRDKNWDVSVRLIAGFGIKNDIGDRLRVHLPFGEIQQALPDVSQ